MILLRGNQWISRAAKAEKREMKVNATVLQRASRPYFAMAIHHRISIEYGFLCEELRAYPYRLCAFIRFSGPRHVTLLPDISFLPCTRRIFLFAKSQLNSVAAGKARRYEIIERTISSSRVPSRLRKSEYINVKKRITLSCEFQILID